MPKRWLPFVVLAAALQATVLYRTLPGGATPDLVQALTVAAAVNGGLASGVWFGFLGGLSLGIVSQTQAGPLSALYLLVGWAVGVYSEARRPLRPRELLMFSGLASLFVWAALLALSGPAALANLPAALAALAPQMLWQTLLLVLLVPLTRR